MNEFMPHFAPFVVLFFLGTVLLIGCSLLVLLFGALRRSRTLAKTGGITLSVVALFYFLILSAASLTSREKVLATGDWKYFCEIDCHIAYSVVDLRSAAVLGPELKQFPAHGEFIIVRVKTWFDEHSISSHRGNGPLTPNRRKVVVVDQSGNEFPEIPGGEKALDEFGDSSRPLSQSLRPGESYVTDLVFDVPKEARGLKLLITEDDPETKLLVGHENSILHKKIYWGLAPKS
jgi:hypothetical protein